MSGSSLDGLDMAYCQFDETTDGYQWIITHAQTIPFDTSLRDELHQAPDISAKDLAALDVRFGKFIGHALAKWMQEEKLQPALIASHGHTVFHEPALGYSLQIGCGAHIAALTGTDTLTSFRQADIAAGGQGAPLACIADRDLLPGYAGYLNLGGIANVTIAGKNQAFTAHDICPCNQALNHLAQKKGFPYDEDGHIASNGQINEQLMESLVSFFPAVKNGAYSLSNQTVQSTWINALDQSPVSVEDKMATTVSAIVHLIIAHLGDLTGKMLVTGGGAFNGFLMDQMQTRGQLQQLDFEKADAQLIAFKECLLMAYLGLLHYHNKSFGLTGITGAMRESIGGVLHKAVK